VCGAWGQERQRSWAGSAQGKPDPLRDKRDREEGDGGPEVKRKPRSPG